MSQEIDGIHYITVFKNDLLQACLECWSVVHDPHGHSKWHHQQNAQAIEGIIRSLRSMIGEREAILQEPDGSVVTEHQLPGEVLGHFIDRVLVEEKEDDAFVAGIYNESSEDEQAEHMLEWASGRDCPDCGVGIGEYHKTGCDVGGWPQFPKALVWLNPRKIEK